MKYRLISFFLIIVICFSVITTGAFAMEQTLPSGIPDSQIGEKINTYIEEHKDTTAGVSIAVFRGQETIYKTGYGYSNIENNLAVNDETVYEWGSVSKLLVWVSVMQLWEQGKINLNEDVKEYLPKDFFKKLKYDEPITMLNLMNHNAGWEDAIFQMCAKDADSVLSLEDALKTIEPRQINAPGKVCAYSNWGVALAGYIVERISGQPFYEYVQNHIFKPLGIERTSVSPLYIDNPWVKSKLLEQEGYSSDLTPIGDGLFYLNIYPAGSTAGTIDDFLKFAQAVIPNSAGAAKLFEKSETHVEMFSPSLTFPGTDIDYNNHGFWSHEYNVQALGHGGNTIMNSSYLLVDPVSGVGLILMANQGGEATYTYGLPQMVFGQMGQMASKEGREDASKISGLYYSGRTIKEGIGKMYALTGLRVYLDDGDGGFKANLFDMLKIEGNQIAPNTFILTHEAGTTRMDSLARYSNDGGTKMLSAIYGDTLKLDTETTILMLALALYMFALLWSGITLISNLIRFIIRKLKKKKHVKDSFKKYQLMLCAAIIALVFIINQVAGMLFSTEAITVWFIPYVIASIVLCLIPFVYAILFFKNRKKLLCGKIQKASYIITMIMGFIMTFTILALELYKL